jgi:hypothetical protein
MKPFAFFKLLIPCLSVLMFLPGCTHTAPPIARTTANKDEAYSIPLQKILIVAPRPSLPGRPDLWSSVAGKLRAKGLTVDIVVQDPLELNKGQAVREAIRRTGATQLLQVDRATTSKTTRTGGYYPGIDGFDTYEAALLSLPDGKVRWRAKTTLGYTRVVDGEHEEAVAESVVTKLLADLRR